MTKVIRIHEFSGTDVLKIEEDEIGAPGPGHRFGDTRTVGVKTAAGLRVHRK